MKKTYLIILLFVFITSIVAQQRGSKPLFIKLKKKQVKLYEQSHALIIGMSNYTNGWNILPGVKKDVIAVKLALEKNGFNVVVKENITKEQLDKAFTDFIGKYGQGKDNRLVIYFAGHGHTVKTSYGETLGYIVPVNSPNPNNDIAGFQKRAMEMAQIEIYAKRIQSKHALFLFDACFSGSLFAMRDAVPAIINYKTKEPVRQFITSGDENESVPDESIFREQFVIALTTKDADANKDGYLTGTELGKFLQDNVVNYSYENQHPQYGKIRNKYLDKGDFVFVVNTKNGNNTDINTTKIEEEDIEPLVTYGNLQITNYLQGKLYIDNMYRPKKSGSILNIV